MTGFYEDDEKLTFDRAQIIVDRFIRQNSELMTHVTCKDVARKFGVEESHHNLIRISEALDKRLQVVRESGTKARQFKLDHETES